MEGLPRDFPSELQNPCEGLGISLLTFSDYPWRSGGVNQLIHTLARALVERGHRVTVYALPNFTRRPAPLLAAVDAGINVVAVPAPLMALRDIRVVGPLTLMRALYRWPHAAMRLVHGREAGTGPADVVIADFTSASAAMASDASGGPPAIVLRWANWAAELADAGRVFGRFRGVLMRREERVLTRARCIVVNGRDIEQDLYARGVESNRVAFVPSAVDTARFSAPYKVEDLKNSHELRDRVILFPSMLRDIKGFDHLLRAVVLLPEPLRATVSVVATGRGDASVYRSLALELGIDEQVVFLGEVSAEELPRWFALSDVAVFPYLFGAGTSVASIEALAAGLPVVAYRVQAFEHVVDDGVTGILVEMGDIDGLSHALAVILGDRDVCERMSHAARLAARQYDVVEVASRLEHVLLGVVRGAAT